MKIKSFRKSAYLNFPIFMLLICLSSTALAEVILDGTVGQKGAVSGPDYVITDKMGSQAGANLFHSFETFNINTNESGTFTGPGGIQNVIGRITGGTSSLIDGRLSCTIPGANLFLINPWGMMFGPNATLDVNGSFHAYPISTGCCFGVRSSACQITPGLCWGSASSPYEMACARTI